MPEIRVPESIFCPRCGASLKLERITDPETIAQLSAEGFSSGARGICPCGVVAVLCVKPLPLNPSFTLKFNIYKFENEMKEVI